MLFGWSVELIVQLSAHDVEVGYGNARPDVDRAVGKVLKAIETYRQPFCTRT